MTADADGPDTGILFHIESRQLLVFMDRFRGQLRARICDVSVAQPLWQNSGVTLALPLNLDLEWNCACWCADNQRIIVADVAQDNAAAYEVTVPDRLSDPWPVVRTPFVAAGSPATAGALSTIMFSKSSSYKKWSYNPSLRAIVYMPYASSGEEDDIVYIYRPRGT